MSIQRNDLRFLLVIIFVVLAGACSKSVPKCVPGSAVVCPCANGLTGQQICLPDGVFDDCSCPATQMSSTPAPALAAPARIEPPDIMRFAPANSECKIVWEGDIAGDGQPEIAIDCEQHFKTASVAITSGKLTAILLGYRGSQWQKLWDRDFSCDSGGVLVKWDHNRMQTIREGDSFTVMFDASCRDTETLTMYTLRYQSGNMVEEDIATKVYVAGGLVQETGRIKIVEDDCMEWAVNSISYDDGSGNRRRLFALKQKVRVQVFRDNSMVIDTGVLTEDDNHSYANINQVSFRSNQPLEFVVFDARSPQEFILFRGKIPWPMERRQGDIYHRVGKYSVTFFVSCYR